MLWFAGVGAVCQVLTIGLLIFGYLYTVRPVYERDRLQEQNSQLEIEAARLVKLADDARIERDAASKNATALREIRQKLEGELRALEEQRTTLALEASTLAKETQSLSRDVVSARADLTKTQQLSRVAQVALLKPWLAGGVNHSFQNQLGTPDFANPKLAPEDIEKAWGDPGGSIIAYFNSLSLRSFSHLPVEAGLILENIVRLQSKTAARSATIHCRTPDFNAWAAAHQEAVRTMPDPQKLCANAHHETLEELSKLTFKPEDRKTLEQYYLQDGAKIAKLCEERAIYDVSTRFELAWFDAIQQCQMHIADEAKEITSDGDVFEKSRIDWNLLKAPSGKQPEGWKPLAD